MLVTDTSPQPAQAPRPASTTDVNGAPEPRAPLDVLVIGAGQAGLAVGHHLARAGHRYLLVDAAPRIGHSWRTRWDSLCLFTPAEYDALPGMPFPAPAGTYPGKDQVADYLDAYAARFDIPVMLNTRVESVERHAGVDEPLFRVSTNQGTLWSRQVVVATGPFQKPHVPASSSGFDPAVTQLHSAEYRHPDRVPSGRVLVVGAGNSGLQIATELSRTHEVHLAVGTRSKAVSQRPFGRDLFWWLSRTGLITKPATSPIAAWFRERNSDLVIGTTWRDIDAAGIAVHPRLTAARGSRAELADGSTIDDVAAVVWATGFRSEYDWLDVPGVWDGHQVRHTRGRTQVPGLWFIGLPWQHTRGSALLGFVGDDAAWLAQQVAAAIRSSIATS